MAHLGGLLSIGRSPQRDRVKEQVRSPKQAQSRSRSPSPARKRQSRSPSPRSKRLRRAQSEREGSDPTEGDRRKTTSREERDSGRYRERDEGKDVSRDRKTEREDSRGSFKDRKLDRDDDRDHSRDRRSYRSGASRETWSSRDDERRDSRGRRSDGDDRKVNSREQRADHDDRRDSARERRADRDESNGESGRSSRRGRSVSPEEHRHRGRHESHQSPRSSRSAAHGEDTSSVTDAASRSVDPDSLVKMNATAEALEAKEKQKPSFELSGKLAEETNRVAGVNLLHSEPPEARKSDIRWRLYVFKGGEPLEEPLYVHRMSSYLFGRERKVADIPTDHPSCSKQHAVLQYRLVEKEQPDGMMSKQVRPYLMDLGSTNGTFINENRIEPSRYYELFEKDTIKFGNREAYSSHPHLRASAWRSSVSTDDGGALVRPSPYISPSPKHPAPHQHGGGGAPPPMWRPDTMANLHRDSVPQARQYTRFRRLLLAIRLPKPASDWL
uniref:FHA domain-containing protein n=1 Tax=Oryza rufipogon TaxID=4529 RepID=A0A0E0PQQ5_ORYRU